MAFYIDKTKKSNMMNTSYKTEYKARRLLVGFVFSLKRRFPC